MLFGFMQIEHKPIIKPSGQVIKVGIIGPFSGVNKNRGEQGIIGFNIAQQLMPYLKNGDSIEWILEDDQDIPEQSIRALKTLTETHKVVIIIMLSASDSVLAVAKVADQYKTPIFTLFATHPGVTQYSSLVNQFSFDDTFQATVAALYIRDELLIDKVAILLQRDKAHFAYLADEFSRQFKATEGVITDSYDLNTQGLDYLQILQSIKNKEPELLYLPIDMENIFKVKAALSTLDWSPQIMLSDGVLASIKAQEKYALDDINGMMTIDAFTFDMKLNRLGKQLAKLIEAEGISRHNIGTNSTLAMESYALLVNVMNRCIAQKYTPLCINNSIRSTLKFEGINGFISFDQTGKVQRSLNINKIYDGVTKLIVRVY